MVDARRPTAHSSPGQLVRRLLGYLDTHGRVLFDHLSDTFGTHRAAQHPVRHVVDKLASRVNLPASEDVWWALNLSSRVAACIFNAPFGASAAQRCVWQVCIVYQQGWLVMHMRHLNLKKTFLHAGSWFSTSRRTLGMRPCPSQDVQQRRGATVPLRLRRQP